ncbi:stage II sporulation protein M [Natronolimnohabitans innermongolicus]|uniref:Stage II sporulation protein M n=1 Tax=Natronolimnohabitans innermongolicus JCM 12255 TaxID=1227499 RepID=L9X1Z3_9EURY|nr:stage II sporulation protein M [Natronolimnohabitans innermongolicus]ELY55622.1 hypothetical protein C493_10982 [Natronolimnohabitans innermongolicus JCM 12255]
MSDDRDWPPDSNDEDAGRDDGQRKEYGVNREYEHDRDSRGTDRPTVDLQDGEGESRASEEDTEWGPGRDPGPGDGGTEPTGAPTPDEETARLWAALTASLAVISLGSAGAIALAYDAPTAVAGAVVLGLGFAAISVVGRTASPALFGYLDEAWAEHRRYVWFSTGLFAVGVALGGLLFAAGVDLTELFLEILQEEFGEDELPGNGGELDGEEQFELTATFFIVNNTPPFLIAAFGALTLGLMTFVIMFFNGVVVGNIAAVTGAEVGLGVVVALLAPHGIFELPALFIAAGVGFRFLHRAVQRIAGSRDALFTTGYVVRTAALLGFAWLILVLAAFVEAYVTFLVADALFGI